MITRFTKSLYKSLLKKKFKATVVRNYGVFDHAQFPATFFNALFGTNLLNNTFSHDFDFDEESPSTSHSFQKFHPTNQLTTRSDKSKAVIPNQMGNTGGEG